MMRILKKRIDRIFSEYIRERDGNRCVLCGSSLRPQCGHLFSRVALNTRWDEENSFCQCSGCNLRHEHDSYPYNNWFIEKFGKDKWDEIHRRWNTVKQWTMQELEDKEVELKMKLNALRSSMVEPHICNVDVPGSSPGEGSNNG